MRESKLSKISKISYTKKHIFFLGNIPKFNVSCFSFQLPRAFLRRQARYIVQLPRAFLRRQARYIVQLPRAFLRRLVFFYCLTSTRRNSLTPCASQTKTAMSNSHTQYACQTPASVSCLHTTRHSPHMFTLDAPDCWSAPPCAVPSITYPSCGNPRHRGITWKGERLLLIIEFREEGLHGAECVLQLRIAAFSGTFGRGAFVVPPCPVE